MARSTIIAFGLASAVALGSAIFTITSSPHLLKASLLTIGASSIALLIFASVSLPTTLISKAKQTAQLTNLQPSRQDTFNSSRTAVATEAQDNPTHKMLSSIEHL